MRFFTIERTKRLQALIIYSDLRFWPDIIGNKLRRMAGSEKQFVLICVDGSENSEFAFECKL